MYLKRFYDDKLAQASFLVGCQCHKEAVVVDANRDVDQYIEAASAQGLKITAVTETHIHADYVSGSRELADRTGATLYLSDEGDADWKYGFSNQPNAKLVRDGDSIRVGRIRLDVIHTPGHTPEHISFLITDEASSTTPLGALTGDFIFVGDVGRPDLLERVANYAGTMERGARVLFHSIEAFKTRQDHLILWPSHGAGSACGKSLGGVPETTLGYEKLANWALKSEKEETFVDHVLSGQPEPPAYFKEMKRINKVGPRILGGFHRPALLGGSRIHDLLQQDAVIVDIRPSADAAAGYIPGTLNIPLGKSFPNWAGWLLPYDRPIYLIADTEAAVTEAVRDLALIGLDEVPAWLGADAIREFEKARGTLETVEQIDARRAWDSFRAGKITILDVRGANEYREGHIPGATHVPLGYLSARIAEVPADKPIAVHCAGGGRSPIAVTVLRKLGRLDVLNMPGGFTEHQADGLPVEKPSGPIA